jgi:hypothetical protein
MKPIKTKKFKNNVLTLKRKSYLCDDEKMCHPLSMHVGCQMCASLTIVIKSIYCNLFSMKPKKT